MESESWEQCTTAPTGRYAYQVNFRQKTEISEFVSPRRHTGSSNNRESAEHGIGMNADVSAVDPLNEVHIPDALLANDEIIDAEITC